MHLAPFIEDLIIEGKVTVTAQLVAFEEDDLKETALLLKEFYADEVLSMPLVAPAYSQEAAVWAAKYFYHAIQLAMLRRYGEAEIERHLKVFDKEINSGVIYSVDLVFRHLPQLIELTARLSPSDVLTKKLKATAHLWPFSSVGIELSEEVDESGILNDLSLKIAYTDRIIDKKDLKRVNTQTKEELVREALGNHSALLWPEFGKIIRSEIDG